MSLPEAKKQSQKKIQNSGATVVGDDVLLFELDGKSGYLDWVIMFIVTPDTDSHGTFLHIYCDDVEVFFLAPLSFNDRGLGNTTPPLYLLEYNVDGVCQIMVTTKFYFTKNIKIYVKNNFTIQPAVAIYGHLVADSP